MIRKMRRMGYISENITFVSIDGTGEGLIVSSIAYMNRNGVIIWSCTLKTKSTSKYLFWSFSLSQTGDMCQYLEGPINTDQSFQVLTHKSPICQNLKHQKMYFKVLLVLKSVGCTGENSESSHFQQCVLCIDASSHCMPCQNCYPLDAIS